MAKHCEQCGKPYDPCRATSRFCGPNCRKAYSRVSVTRPDYESPNVTLSDHDLLELWANGPDPRQRQLGILNKQYGVIKHGHPKSELKGYVVNAKDVA